MEGMRNCIRMRLRDYGRRRQMIEMKGRAHDMIKPGGFGLHLMRDAFDRSITLSNAAAPNSS